jgi:multisubunit Na+/H+ antiporter MnhG subunit
MLDNAGKLLIYAGAGLLVLGLLIVLLGKIPGFGRLPGDLFFRRGNLTVYFPLGTMLLLGVLLTVALNLLSRWRR